MKNKKEAGSCSGHFIEFPLLQVSLFEMIIVSEPGSGDLDLFCLMKIFSINDSIEEFHLSECMACFLTWV